MDNQFQKDVLLDTEGTIKRSKEYKSAAKNFGIAQAVEIYEKSDHEKEKVIVTYNLLDKEISDQIEANPKYSSAKTKKKELAKEFKAKLQSDQEYVALNQKYERIVNDPDRKQELAQILLDIKTKESDSKKALKENEDYQNACQVLIDFNRSKADRLKEPKISSKLCVKFLSEMKKAKKKIKDAEKV